MVDFESRIFAYIKPALSGFTGIKIESVNNLSPSQFPCACIEQADNYIYERGIDSGDIENFVTVMFEVNVYSNKKDGKKKEAKQIFSAISDKFKELGFTRTYETPINMADSTIYRLTGRFMATISKDFDIYRR